MLEARDQVSALNASTSPAPAEPTAVSLLGFVSPVAPQPLPRVCTYAPARGSVRRGLLERGASVPTPQALSQLHSRAGHPKAGAAGQ